MNLRDKMNPRDRYLLEIDQLIDKYPKYRSDIPFNHGKEDVHTLRLNLEIFKQKILRREITRLSAKSDQLFKKFKESKSDLRISLEFFKFYQVNYSLANIIIQLGHFNQYQELLTRAWKNVNYFQVCFCLAMNIMSSQRQKLREE